MSDTPWTYHTTQIIPSRKAHRVMEGIKPIASCNSEKHARLIIRLYNEKLRKELVKAKEN